jgi:two-component system sensor histidine kinase/response regulator
VISVIKSRLRSGIGNKSRPWAKKHVKLNSHMETLKPKLLCVDDESDNLDALERLFRKKYEVLKATSAAKAFEILDNCPDIAVIISDQRMPVISGVEFLEKSIASHINTSRILLTGYTDIESVIAAVNKGQIFRYLTKPWDAADLTNTTDQALEKYLLKTELKEKNNELHKALDELKNLDNAKNQFMILINHELKTPLTTILSFAGLLKETSLSEEQTLFTSRIIKSSEKLKNIVEDVLLIVKGEVGLIPVKKDNMNCDWLIKNIAPEVNNSIKAKNQEIKFETSLDNIELDRQLTYTAFTRALHNATKFGLAQSEIQVKIFKDINYRCIICIENKGPTISPQIIEKIMKPFLLDENIMNHSVGMGLGLSICNTLMKCQNGELSVVNRSNGVSVYLKFR